MKAQYVNRPSKNYYVRVSQTGKYERYFEHCYITIYTKAHQKTKAIFAFKQGQKKCNIYETFLSIINEELQTFKFHN